MRAKKDRGKSGRAIRFVMLVVISVAVIVIGVMAAMNYGQSNARRVAVEKQVITLGDSIQAGLPDFTVVKNIAAQPVCANEKEAGFNPWNVYGCSVSETRILKTSATISPNKVQNELLNVLDENKVSGYTTYDTYSSDGILVYDNRAIGSELGQTGTWTNKALTIPGTGYPGVSQTNSNNGNKPAGLADASLSITLYDPNVNQDQLYLDSTDQNSASVFFKGIDMNGRIGIVIKNSKRYDSCESILPCDWLIPHTAATAN